ncbi:MAG: hypothetical protein PHR06_00120 [Candidatus Cloacimonetes bacterium]|nr:hypothetical protein [Candidatus Cloacimonadota bacterium]
MPIIEGRDFSGRRVIPSGIKLLLMLAVIMGFYVRSCWNKKKAELFLISEIKIEEVTLSTIEITFRLKNLTSANGKESVFIKAYSDNGDLIASRITSVEVQPDSDKVYRKLLEKFNRPLQKNESITKVTVEYYKSSIL